MSFLGRLQSCRADGKIASACSTESGKAARRQLSFAWRENTPQQSAADARLPWWPVLPLVSLWPIMAVPSRRRDPNRIRSKLVAMAGDGEEQPRRVTFWFNFPA